MSPAGLTTRRFDLPLETTAASRFLLWIIAGFVYLAVVALAVAAVGDGALSLYNMRAKLVTVTLPSAADAQDAEREVDAALDLLRRTRGVLTAQPVPMGELEALIQPWLGDLRAADDLPLPRLIDVSLDPAAKPDLPALQERLREVAPSATIGVEALSRDRAERLAAFFRLWGSAAGIAALLALLLVVALITRTSLDSHGDTVEMLRLMGAADGYLARQFERHALLSGARGGLLGFVFGALTVAALLYSSRRMDLAGSIQLSLGVVDWILLACVPVVTALLIMAVARMTALWRLGRTA